MGAVVKSATFCVGVFCLLGGLLLSGRVSAQSLEDHVSPSDFGGVGLLQTRTARFGPDGLFNFGASRVEPYDRVYLSLHFLPGLEATFRYLSITNRPFRFAGEVGTFLDRGADLKFKLLDEGRYAPALALGFQDTIGTGLFATEYIVASKRYYDLDFSLGMVWGHAVGSRGGFKNPLIALADGFRDRTDPTGKGGRLRLGSFFSGERVALFGGVEYRTPIKGLSLKLEYDPNDYQAEPLGNRFEQDIPFNIGINYRPFSWLEGSLGIERGNTLMARLSLRSELNKPGIPNFLDKPPPPLRPRPQPGKTSAAPAAARLELEQARSTIGWAAGGLKWSRSEAAKDLANRLFDGLEAGGLEVESVELEEAAATLRVVWRFAGDARPEVERAAAVVAAALPAETETFTFVVRLPGAGEQRLSLTRRDLRQRAIVDSLFDGLEGQGFEVQALDLSKAQATIHLATTFPRPDYDYKRAALLVAERMPMPVGEVTVVGLRQGVEEARLTLRVQDPVPVQGASSGGRHQSPVGKKARGRAEVGPSPSSDRRGKDRIAARVFEELEAEGFDVDAFHLTETRATVFVTPRRYPEAARNIGRAARAAANNAPAGVEEITVVTVIAGVENSRVTILRKDLENAVLYRGSPEEIWANATIGAGRGGPAEDATLNPDRYPSFSWSLRPALRSFVGAPESPYLFQIWARLGAGLEFLPGLSVRGVVGRDIFNNFDRIRRGPKGTLPHVRSDIKRYLQEGENNLVRLQADYIFQPAESLYARASAGIFEEMFGGVGGEVLYRPLTSRWAFGIDINRVRQRDFDQRLGFLDYEVTTGHFSVYYKMPFYDLLGSVHVGQYLAGDRGATFRLSRRFKSGVAVGAWFTLTNVSPEEFGEGSFDKGFFFSIPFELFLPKSTRSRAGFGFRPLSSDGGQMLNLGSRLYGVTGEADLGHIARDWPSILD